MKKISISFFLILLLTNVYSQVFNPPINLDGWADSDSTYIYWQAPVDKSFSHYNIYYYAYNNGVHQYVNSTVNTEYALAMPTFAYSFNVGVSAKYNNPTGESDTIWISFICPWGWNLPMLVDFEDPEVYSCGLVSSTIQGEDNWELIDTSSYSQTHSAVYISNLNHNKAQLITTLIDINDSQDPTLKFMCKIPQNDGHTDTLKLYYSSSGNWVQFLNPLLAINDWQLIQVSLNTLPSLIHFAFEATSGGGNGVYLDDILFVDDAISTPELIYGEPILEIAPNPVKNTLSLNLTNIKSSNCQINIVSTDGKTLISKDYKIQTPGVQKYNIDVSGINSGLYFLSIRLDNGVFTKKFIKN